MEAESRIVYPARSQISELFRIKPWVICPPRARKSSPDKFQPRQLFAIIKEKCSLSAVFVRRLFGTSLAPDSGGQLCAYRCDG